MVYAQTWRGGLGVLWLLMTFVWTTVLAQDTIPITKEGFWLSRDGYDYTIDKSATATFIIPKNTLWDHVVITASGYRMTGPTTYTGREYQIILDGVQTRTGSQGTTTIFTDQLDGRTIVTLATLPGSDSTGIIVYKVEGFNGPTNSPNATVTPAFTTSSTTSSSSSSRSSSTSSTSSTSTTLSTSTSVAALLVTTSSGTPLTINDPLVSFPSQAATPTGGSSIAAANDASTANSKRTSTIVGVVLGLLALAVLCVFLVMWYRRKLRKDRIPPSMAYMNYRSTTTEPPVYGFAPSRAGGGGGGIRDLKGAPADRDTLYSNNAAGLGAHGAHGGGNWDDEKYAYGAIPATRGYHDGATASLPWPAPPTTTGMMPGQFNKPLPAVAPSTLMQQGQQPNPNPFSASNDPIISTTSAPMQSQDSAVGGPMARTLTPEPDRSSRASSAFGDMNPYGGIALGVMPTATAPAPTFPTAAPVAAVPPPMAQPMAPALTGMPAQNVPQNMGGMPFQPQQAMGNPFLGPSEENFAGRGAGQWNHANNA